MEGNRRMSLEYCLATLVFSNITPDQTGHIGLHWANEGHASHLFFIFNLGFRLLCGQVCMFHGVIIVYTLFTVINWICFPFNPYPCHLNVSMLWNCYIVL